MQMSIKKTIGKNSYAFIVEGKNLHDLVIEAEKLSFYDVYKCGLCGSDSLYLTAYTTKEEGYKYVKVVCAKCKGSVTFGQQKKSPDTFYLRKTDDGQLDWQISKETSTAESKKNTNKVSTKAVSEDDYPF